MLELLNLLQQGHTEQSIEAARELAEFAVKAALICGAMLVLFVIADIISGLLLTKKINRLEQRLSTLEKDAEIEKRVKQNYESTLKS